MKLTAIKSKPIFSKGDSMTQCYDSYLNACEAERLGKEAEHDAWLEKQYFEKLESIGDDFDEVFQLLDCHDEQITELVLNLDFDGEAEEQFAKLKAGLVKLAAEQFIKNLE